MTLRRWLWAWLPAILYMVLIWTLSSLETVNVPIEAMPFQDKGAHFIEYTGLGALIMHACIVTWPSTHRFRIALLSIVATSAWGAMDEFHQSFVPGRNSDIFDLGADVSGACVGTFLCHLLYRFWLDRRLASE